MVDADWLELVRDDVARLLAPTFLSGCPMLPVSSKTGEGLSELRQALSGLARAVPAKAVDQTARLPIDRVFTVKGFGTVVTGTLTAGRLAIDERVEVYPRGLQSKVRGLQAHGRAVGQAEAGQRTAVNLQGIERSAIERGDVVAPAGALLSTVLVDATVELLDDAPRPLKTRDRVRFHVGTQEVMARVLLVGRPDLAPGGGAHGRFRLEAPVVALPGDRYVIRSYSPIVTIGGGTLLDVAPPRFKRKAPALLAHLELLEAGTPAQVVEEHLRQAGAAGARIADLRARTPFGPERLRELLDALQQAAAVVAVDREWYIHRSASDRLRGETLGLLETFHRENPLRAGISREELRSRAGNAQERVFAQLLGQLESEGLVRSEKDQVRLASHSIRLTPDQQRVVEGLETDFRRAGAAPPSPEEALSRLGVKGTEKHELFQVLVADRRLLRVKESLYFHAEVLHEIQDKVVHHLREKKEIGPADVKDLLGVSRKYAIPLMEYFDAQRVTVRVGERRVLRGAERRDG
jgi:selenocysteine-specific elongation factor